MELSWESFRNAFAHFHPALVHFPIGLVLSGAALETWSALMRRGAASETARILLVLGSLGALLAAGSGLALFNPGDFRERTLDVARIHRFLGLASAICALISVSLGGVGAMRPLMGSRLGLYRIAYWFTAILVGLAGHYGGWVVFGWGLIWTP